MKTNTKQTILKCKDLKSFLASLPVLMGYTVQNSIVIVLFKGNRVATSMRFDLPDRSKKFADSGLDIAIISQLERFNWLDAVALIIYTDEEFAGSLDSPRFMLSKWLQLKLQKSGFSVRENVCIAKDAWQDNLDISAPVGGRKLTEIYDSEASLEATALLTEPLKKLEDIGQEVPVKSLLKKIEPIIDNPKHKSFSANKSGLKKVVRAASKIDSGHIREDDIDSICFFVNSLENPAAWLIAMAFMALGEEGALTFIDIMTHEEIVDINTYAADPLKKQSSPFAASLLMFSERQIDPGALSHTIKAFTNLLGQIPKSSSSNLMSLLAWAWWMTGVQTPAYKLIDEVLKSNPKNFMGDVVKELLTYGAPGWIYDRAPAV